MKKASLIFLTFVFGFSVLLSNDVSANEENLNKLDNAKYLELEDKGLSFEYIDENTFELYIPSFMADEQQMKQIIDQQSNPKARIGGWAIVEIAGSICWLLTLPVKGFDPCGYIVQQSLKGLATGKPALSGKYKVTYSYVPGNIPGCEPMHSGPCNSGYYVASFSKV